MLRHACLGRTSMRNERWLLLCAGLLLVLTPSGSRGQEAINPGSLVRTFPGHTKAVNDVAFRPDGQRLVSGSDDATVRIWELDTGKELHALRGHGESSIRGVAFSPDGRWVASAGCDQRVVL